MSREADALVITPHPDDAEIEAGGTVARWIREGRQVVFAVCTNGDKGTTDRSLAPGELARIREGEQRRAAGILGVREVVFLGLPDQGLEDSPAFRREIVRLIRTYRPRTVVAPDPYRRYLWHRDHRITGQVTLDAVFPFARDHLAYPDLLAQGLEPHKVREILLWAAEEVNHRCDITATFDRKVAAVRCHESQIKEFGIPDVEAWLRETGRERCAGEGPELCEAFHRVELPP